MTRSSARPTRRTFLAMTAAAGVPVALGGCGEGFGSSGDSGGGGDGGGHRFKIPDAPEGFPTDDVTVRILQAQEPFWQAFGPAYEEKFSNVTLQHEKLTAEQVSEVVPLGFRNQTAHDITQLAQAIRLPDAVAEGLLAPLDECIPDFDTWKSNLPEMAKVEGVQVIDGKMYQVAPSSERRHQFITHYHKQLMNDAGFDPSSEPLTWDTFREAARKVTEQGDGQTYGFALEINQTGRLRRWFIMAARLAGLKTEKEISYANGEYIHTAPELLDAVELVQSIMADGSMIPGAANMTQPQVRARVVSGDAAMCMAGPWVAAQWVEDEPDFEFGVAEMPVRGDDPYPANYDPFGANPVSIPAFSEVKMVAGHILNYVISAEGQAEWAKIMGVGGPPFFPEAQDAGAEDLTEQERRCLELADTMTYGPVPEVRNPDVTFVEQRLKAPNPNFGQVLQAILVGEEPDARKALTNLKDRSERALDAAIAEAKKLDGSTATREDYVFPNWDPRQNFELADYPSR